MAQPIEKNNIPLPEGARNKEGGLNYENKDRCHALVVGSSGYSSLIIDLGALRNMDSIQDSFLTLHPYSGPSIQMSDDSEIPTKGVGGIDLDNGYLNNVLYVPYLVEKLLSIY